MLPLRGSSAPVGYIYDASLTLKGCLLAAVLAFFSHQGHQVFHNPCPNLTEYRRAMGVSLLAVVSVDHLPNHPLSLGLELMAGLCAPSLTGAKFLGTIFMAAYLSPSVSSPVLVRGPQVSSSVGGPPVSSLAAAPSNVALPVSSVGGPYVGLSVGVLQFLRRQLLGGMLLCLSPLWALLVSRGVPVQGVVLIPAVSPPRVSPQHFHSRGFHLLPWHLPSGPLPELLLFPLFRSWGVPGLPSSSHDGFCWLWCFGSR
jgi:hypothetical protein